MPKAMVLILISYYFGRMPLGWWLLRSFGYRGHFPGIYTNTCFRQALLDFGWEGALVLLLSGLLKGSTIVWWAQAWGLSRPMTWVIVCLMVFGACRTHWGKYQDGSPLFTVMGTLVLLAPAVWQLSLAIWFASLILFRRIWITGLVTSMSLPWIFGYYHYAPWETTLGFFLSMALVNGITNGRVGYLWQKPTGVQ